MEEILVLDHGWVRLEETMGDEATVLNVARMSTGATKTSMDDFAERDYRLLSTLLQKNHGTPFETIVMRFRVECPIFVARQWMRHRIGTFNEYSQRYREPMFWFYTPNDAALTVDGFRLLTEDQQEKYYRMMCMAEEFYCDTMADIEKRMEDAGVLDEYGGGRNKYRGRAREILRNVVPVATYTEISWTVNFRSFLNFLELRLADGAQWEIQEYARACKDLFKRKFPILCGLVDERIDK